jgi:probable phosphoglycerate mutase
LRRTRETAEIIRTVAGIAAHIKVDERLREIDYGLWEGRSNAEIEAAHGRADLDAWSKRGVWPEGMDWRPGRAELLEGLAALVRELAAERTVLLVSSNGILKHLPDALTLPASDDLKVRTGHLCVLDITPDPRVVAWNVAPDDL